MKLLKAGEACLKCCSIECNCSERNNPRGAWEGDSCLFCVAHPSAGAERSGKSGSPATYPTKP